MEKIKILVVDDEPEIRESLARFLSKNGYGVATAASGNEALKIYQSTPVSVVISDMRMADGDGVFY